MAITVIRAVDDIKGHTVGETDQEHPPLSLEEVLSVPDASLDLTAPLDVGVVYVSPALQQHVGHQEHKGAQLLLFFHLHEFNRDTTRRELIYGNKYNKYQSARVLLLQLLTFHDKLLSTSALFLCLASSTEKVLPSSV